MKKWCDWNTLEIDWQSWLNVALVDLVWLMHNVLAYLLALHCSCFSRPSWSWNDELYLCSGPRKPHPEGPIWSLYQKSGKCLRNGLGSRNLGVNSGVEQWFSVGVIFFFFLLFVIPENIWPCLKTSLVIIALGGGGEGSYWPSGGYKPRILLNNLNCTEQPSIIDILDPKRQCWG